MNNYIIYGLREIGTNEFRYIGLTTKSINDRLRRHLRDKKVDHKTNWIKKVGKENIEIVIIEDGIDTYEKLCEKEIFYISEYRKTNRLTNIANGGEGWFGMEFTDEHKNNISKNHADVSGDKNPMFGKTHTKETMDKIKSKIENWMNNGGFNESQLRKMSDSKKGQNNNKAKLTSDDVINIRNLFGQGITYKEISNMYSVNKPAIFKIVKRINWKHI